MSAAGQHSFSSIFNGVAIKNRNQAKDVRTKSEKTSAFEMVSTKVTAKPYFIKLTCGLKPWSLAETLLLKPKESMI